MNAIAAEIGKVVSKRKTTARVAHAVALALEGGEGSVRPPATGPPDEQAAPATVTLTGLKALALPTKTRGTVQPLEAALVREALLTMATARAVSGLSAATIYRKAATDPTFPKLIRLGTRCTRIRAGELTDWLAAQGEA